MCVLVLAACMSEYINQRYPIRKLSRESYYSYYQRYKVVVLSLNQSKVVFKYSKKSNQSSQRYSIAKHINISSSRCLSTEVRALSFHLDQNYFWCQLSFMNLNFSSNLLSQSEHQSFSINESQPSCPTRVINLEVKEEITLNKAGEVKLKLIHAAH